MSKANASFEWLPSLEGMAQSNLTAFLSHAGESNIESLSVHADEDPAWLMQQVMAFCDFRFYKPYTQMLDTSQGMANANWCVGGTTNIVLNCLDRHRGTPTWNKTFLVWEGEDPKAQRAFTYGEFDAEVCRLAGALQGLARADCAHPCPPRDARHRTALAAHRRPHHQAACSAQHADV